MLFRVRICPRTELNKLRLGQGREPATWGPTGTKPHACAVTLLEDTREAKTGAEARVTGCTASVTRLCDSYLAQGQAVSQHRAKVPSKRGSEERPPSLNDIR